MELNEYQSLAMKTKKPWGEDVKGQLTDSILGLTGESGEVADIIKKYFAGVKELDKDHLINEMGDVMWYLAELAETLGTTLDEIATLNIEKLKARHGEKFSGYGNRSGKGK